MKQETVMELLALALKSDVKPEKGVSKGGDIRIVILQRGWIYVGNYFQDENECYLENASCIRSWGTSKGLGELAEGGPTGNTKLDPCPTVRFHPLTAVATIDCNQTIWNKKL